MGPDLNEAPRATACPSCGAALRADATWCSLCYHDLRAVAVPVAPEPTPLYGDHDPLTASLLDVLLPETPVVVPVTPATPQAQLPVVPGPGVPAPQAEASWPCTRCGAANVLTSDACRDCGSRFLGGASDVPALVLPGVGDLTRLSRGHRAMVAVGLVMAVLLPLALITFLLTGEPPTDGAGTDTTVTIVEP